jgi:hypothetical protein
VAIRDRLHRGWKLVFERGARPIFFDGSSKWIRNTKSRDFVTTPRMLCDQIGNSIFHNAYAFADSYYLVGITFSKRCTMPLGQQI